MLEHKHQEPWVQTVAPNKATVETLYVILAALWVIGISSLVIKWNQVPHAYNEITLTDADISLRYDLKPSEQGIYSDLLIVYQDWQLMEEGDAAAPIALLIEDEWPPFTDAVAKKNRGSHEWSKHTAEHATYYLGISQNKEISGDFLWVLPQSRSNSTMKDFDVFLYKGNDKPALRDHIHQSDLINAGWKKINPVAAINRDNN